ncbi:MAG: hypothetical protein AAB728_03190 [Patescibacteria group bacterium]
MSHPFEPHAGGIPESERRYATYDQTEQAMLEQSRTLYAGQAERSAPLDDGAIPADAQQIARQIAGIIVGTMDLPPHFPDHFPGESERNAAIASRVFARHFRDKWPPQREEGEAIITALHREAEAHESSVQEGIRQAAEGILRLMRQSH